MRSCRVNSGEGKFLINRAQCHGIFQYRHRFGQVVSTGIEPQAGRIRPHIRDNPGFVLTHEKHLLKSRNLLVQFQFLAQVIYLVAGSFDEDFDISTEYRSS